MGWPMAIAMIGSSIVGGLLGKKGADAQARAIREAAEKQGSPWAGQAPYLLDMFKEAQNLYKGDQPIIAPWNGTQQLGNAGIVRGALAGAGAVSPQALSAWQRMTSPEMLDVANNPYVMGGARAITDEATRALMEQVLPRIDMSAVRAGQYGSSRQALAQGQAVGKTQQALSDTLRKYLSQAYGQGLGAQNQALALTPTVQTSLVAPWETIFSAGERQRAKTEREMRAPWERLALYQGIVGGQQYGGNKQYIPPSGINPALAGLGGAMQGYGLARGMMNTFGGFNQQQPIDTINWGQYKGPGGSTYYDPANDFNNWG